MEHSLEGVKRKFMEILMKRFGFFPSMFEDEALDQEFLGEKIRMSAIELLYIYTDIEKHFGISIPEKDIVSGRFNTINNISAIIHKNLMMKDAG